MSDGFQRSFSASNGAAKAPGQLVRQGLDQSLTKRESSSHAPRTHNRWFDRISGRKGGAHDPLPEFMRSDSLHKDPSERKGIQRDGMGYFVKTESMHASLSPKALGLMFGAIVIAAALNRCAKDGYHPEKMLHPGSSIKEMFISDYEDTDQPMRFRTICGTRKDCGEGD